MRKQISSLRLSISTRLTLWYGISFMLLLSIFVIYIYSSTHVGLHRDFESELVDHVSRLQAAVSIDHGVPTLNEAAVIRSVAYQTEGVNGTYVRLFGTGGAVRYQSPNFNRNNSFAPDLPPKPEAHEQVRTWQGIQARSRYTPLYTGSGNLVGWLEVTRLESDVHHELHRLRWLLAVGVLAGGGLAMIVGLIMARRALRPVSTIIMAAREVEAGDPSRRIPEAFGVQDEMTDLAQTLNALLARIDDSFARERQFMADATHEMFTPLTALQSEIEVALIKPRTVRGYRGVLATLQTHVRRLIDLVEDLLHLSRASATPYRATEERAVSTVVQSVIERFRASAATGEIDLRYVCKEDLKAAVAPAHLKVMVENLLDNAIKYTPPSGRVEVSFCQEGDQVVLTVSDTGIGFTPDEADRIFDRFYRGDSSMITQVRGSGLGLSIVKATTDGYGGLVEAHSPGRGKGSTFRVYLPQDGAEGVV